MKITLKTIGTIILILVVAANLIFSVFLFSEQTIIYKEVRTLEKTLTDIGQELGQTVEGLSVRESVALERRNSIKVSNAKFGEDILEVSFKLGSDISSVARVFQDWGDHSQPPKVDNISFDVNGKVLSFEFTPVVNSQNGQAVVVIQAQSATLGKQIEVEAIFDLENRKVTQSGDYTKEPL